MKKDHPLLIVAAFIAALVASLHIAASAFYWYWTIPWLDTVLHFLGGIFTALLVFWYIKVENKSEFLSDRRSGGPLFLLVIGLTILIGVGWEVIEKFAGVINEADYILDTGTDLAMDLLGALAAYYFAFSRFKDTILTHDTGAEK